MKYKPYNIWFIKTPTEIKTENLIKRIKSIKNKWKIIYK